MSSNRTIKIRPSHLELTIFLQSIFPSHPRDVPLLYHTPRHPRYDPVTTPIHDLVLSITPTSGVYNKLTELSSLPLPEGTIKWQLIPRPACFLHRPWDLDRRAVPRGTLVLSSHKRFDELLTVGWNVALAERLGLDVDRAVCIQGYKGDPERRIGLVAALSRGGTKNLGDVYTAITREFGGGDLHIGQMAEGQELNKDLEPTNKEGGDGDYNAGHENEIAAVAIMNAFGPDEVTRAITCAVEAKFVSVDGGYKRLLYLTGEAKPAGLATLNERYHGMAATCVGHLAAEEWGIRYLSEYIHQKWPDLNVHTVFEKEEVALPRRQASAEQKPGNKS